MNILHINTHQQGGAALCAIRINNALVQEGVCSKMLFAEGEGMPEGVKGAVAEPDQCIWKRNRLLRKLRKILMHFPWKMNAEIMQKKLKEANKHDLYIHHPFSDYKGIAHHPLVEWADIIHLHWVSGFVDYPSFFCEVKKPIVWTLHDKNPIVGIQHFNSRYYPVPSELKDLDSYCLRIKRNSVAKAKKIIVVAISESMVEECKSSCVFCGFPVALIHNGVDTSVFHPYGKEITRKELGIDSKAKVFLFSSYGIQDKNKGFDRLLKAMEKVDVLNKVLVCIGAYSADSIPHTSFPVFFTGTLADQEKIAKYYSAADFFLQCSYEESFGQTLLEAMACGTPVISTLCGVAKELILPFNGVICDGFDSEAIATGIKEAFKVEYNASEIRQYIVDNYQYDKIICQYMDLYKKIISDN